MARKKPILLPLSGVSDASGDLTLKTKPMGAGGLLCVQLISVRNDDTASCLAHIGVERAGLVSYLETIVMTTAGYTYPYYHPIWVPSDYRVVVKFASAGNKKACYAVVFGYLDPSGEG